MKEKCYIDNCEKEWHSRGLCKRHYSYACDNKLPLDDREFVRAYTIKHHREFKPKRCYICGAEVDSKGLCLKHYDKCLRARIDTDDLEAVKSFIIKSEERSKRIRLCHGPYRVIDNIREAKTGQTVSLYRCYDFTEAKIAYNKAMEILYGKDGFEPYSLELDESEYKAIYDKIRINLMPREQGVGSQGLKTKKKKTSSKYVGVCIRREKSRVKYVAYITYKKKNINLGYFPLTPEGENNAAVIYNQAAILLYEDKAVLNEVENIDHLVIDDEKILNKKREIDLLRG